MHSKSTKKPMKVVDLKNKINPNAFQHANAHLKQIIHYELSFFQKNIYTLSLFVLFTFLILNKNLINSLCNFVKCIHIQ